MLASPANVEALPADQQQATRKRGVSFCREASQTKLERWGEVMHQLLLIVFFYRLAGDGRRYLLSGCLLLRLYILTVFTPATAAAAVLSGLLMFIFCVDYILFDILLFMALNFQVL